MQSRHVDNNYFHYDQLLNVFVSVTTVIVKVVRLPVLNIKEDGHYVLFEVNVRQMVVLYDSRIRSYRFYQRNQSNNLIYLLTEEFYSLINLTFY